jgi:hypothetical protein
MAAPKLPNDSQRLAIVGRTGSGKTYAAAWHLSGRSWTKRPWIVFDFKGDSLLSEIPRAEEISITDNIPKHKGVYIVRPLPNQEEAVDGFLWKLWAAENAGVYVDEGYMIGARSAPFNAILTQGRSKNIPLIVLSQRPVWMSRFVWSEADFYQVFHLNNREDNKVIEKFCPVDLSQRLPPYHSHYYDVSADNHVLLGPVPNKNKILNIFDMRSSTRRKIL